ncbi:MAG: hypothetical protein R3355_11610 [Pseudomonas sp.]|uniref:hypothetical protein n=1 Tax=Pseudomonas sp. TaxID=306 RepID=UPI00299F4834|nr:hypothetical protein [Pseudomonas sp.]MDX1723732.1 hypothetical protein [Pseudomonas sp.]
MPTNTEHENNITDFPSNESKIPERLPEETLIRIRAYEEEQKIKSAETKKVIYLFSLISLVFLLLIMASIRNPGIYEIDQDTLLFINKGYNALILLTIPFLLGMIGAIARLLLSGIKITQELSLTIGSGLMAVFSWVGIKSGVLLAIIAPHIEQQGIGAEELASSSSDFYTMVLVAVFVGMFSTNLYLFISQRVEQLSNKDQESKN